jgi:crossover junction endodeoxyribonuclease RusA
MQIRPTFKAKEINMTITFRPPNNRRRDRDNLIAAMKSGMDGIAEAWGVDDSRFVPTYRMGEPVARGEVIIEIGE